MKKTLQIKNLDCAHCALKIEQAIQKLPEVTDAKVHFFSQKMMVEADEAGWEDTVKKIKKTARKIEPGCKIEE